MKETLKKVWDSYFFEECAVIETDEERQCMKKAAWLQERAHTLLQSEQQSAVEKYVDALRDMQSLFLKKAFFKGCEFAISFLLKTGHFMDE